ncbi:MAG TPA: SBBP repeat-containing protein, partial [Armatimonadota bacterium]
MTSSIDFPGAEYRRRRGRDIFVRSLSGSYTLTGSTSIYGGNGDDVVTGADLSDSYRGLLIYGYTDSTDLPTNLSLDPATGQSGAWQPDYGGGASDGMILTITSDQRNPIYLSYVGGPGDDRVTGSTRMWGWTPILVGSTTQRGLPAPAPIYELGPGGGTDGFLLALTAYANPEIRSLTYFGGSGDDRPLGITYANNADLLVTGETNSADFPLAKSFQTQRAGETDAFLMRVVNFAAGPVVWASTLMGGSGSDRGVKLVSMPNGEVVMGGVTNSPDLVMVKPLQAAYGGGASDTFLARFAPDLSRLVSSTYFGGSGADELTSLSTDSVGNLFAGGFTNSPDFPLKNAVQPSYGGGADDGFFLHLDSDGTVHHASYLGGSGSDRILGMSVEGEFSVIVSGQTSSPDFPIAAADQSTLAGSASGFLTRISTNLLGVGRVISGKNLRASFPLSIGRGASAVEIVVTSSDPSKVLVAQRPTDPGQGSIVQGTPPFGQGRVLYVDCLVDRG